MTTDKGGHVYIADGDVFEYSAEGKAIRTIHVPERPIDLVFGGEDGSTLFILARTSIYAWHPASTQ